MPRRLPINRRWTRYRYWRRHILLTIWLGYALFYFTRKSFNAAVPEILASNV
jgi:OPA family sugar phosphate sensor protein UhpC-like MFS transporter